MSQFFFLVLALLSIFIFFNLLRFKASSKQTNRENKINWGQSPYGWKRQQNSKKSGTIIEGKAEEVKRDNTD